MHLVAFILHNSRSIGVSNFNVHHLEPLIAARHDHIPVINQIELNPFVTRDELVKYCQREGIVLQAYSPLTRGQKLKEQVLIDMARK